MATTGGEYVPTVQGGGEGVRRALEKLAASLDAGDTYSSLQLFKTQHARAKKRGDWADALGLAHGGAAAILQRGDAVAGAELAVDYINIAATKPPADLDERLVELDALFGKIPPSDDVTRERKRFLSAAIEASSSVGGAWAHGEPRLHKSAALMALKEGNYPVVARHMLVSDDSANAASFIVAWARRGPDSEVDLHLTRFLLQLLALGDLRGAQAFHAAFVAQFPQLDTPLTHFCDMVLVVVERHPLALLRHLRTKYARALDRAGPDVFAQLLDDVEAAFYGVVHEDGKGGGGMMNILQSLMGN